MVASPVTAFSDASAPPLVVAPVTGAPPPAPQAKRRAGRENDIVDGSNEYRLVPLQDLQEDPDNTRQTFRKLDELAESIRVVGLEQPITARIDENGSLTIIDGARRFRAIKQILKWELVPVIIRYGVKPSSILAKMLAVNSQRDDLDPIDEARGIRRYMLDHKIATQDDAAKALGTSLGWVSGRLALLRLDDSSQQKVIAGTMTIGAGVRLAREQSGTTRVSRQMREQGVVPATRTTYSPPKNLAHFSDDHHLAGRVRSRCRVHDFPKPLVGGVGCGACWEIVIRLDAGRHPLAITGEATAEQA